MTSSNRERLRYLKDRGWRFHRQAHGAHQLWIYDPSGATILVTTSTSSTGYDKAFRRKVEKLERTCD